MRKIVFPSALNNDNDRKGHIEPRRRWTDSLARPIFNVLMNHELTPPQRKHFHTFAERILKDPQSSQSLLARLCQELPQISHQISQLVSPQLRVLEKLENILSNNQDPYSYERALRTLGETFVSLSEGRTFLVRKDGTLRGELHLIHEKGEITPRRLTADSKDNAWTLKALKEGSVLFYCNEKDNGGILYSGVQDNESAQIVMQVEHRFTNLKNFTLADMQYLWPPKDNGTDPNMGRLDEMLDQYEATQTSRLIMPCGILGAVDFIGPKLGLKDKYNLPQRVANFIDAIDQLRANPSLEIPARSWMDASTVMALAMGASNMFGMSLDSTIDPLTKLENRRNCLLKLRGLIERYLETGEDVAIVMADIDDFSKYNNKYSHAHGDMILETISEILMKSFREYDNLSVVRLGGEEILILLPFITREDALKALYRCRKALKETGVTLSFGVINLSTISELPKDLDPPENEKTAVNGINMDPETKRFIAWAFGGADIAVYNSKRHVDGDGKRKDCISAALPEPYTVVEENDNGVAETKRRLRCEVVKNEEDVGEICSRHPKWREM